MKAIDKVKLLEKKEVRTLQCDLDDSITLINNIIKKGYTILRCVNNGSIAGNKRILIEFK